MPLRNLTSIVNIVRKVSRVSLETWSKVAKECEYATFFHTPDWAVTINSNFPRKKISTLSFRLSDGAIAILPMIDSPFALRGLLVASRSMDLGTYGGPICTRPLHPTEIEKILRVACSFRRVSLVILENPFKLFLENITRKNGNKFTQYIDLSIGFDSVINNFASSAKRNVRKAQEAGVEVVAATSLDDYDRYYKIYEDSIRRWGDKTTAVYSKDYIRSIARISPRNATLWLAVVNGIPISGAIVFYWGKHAMYWHGANLQEYLKYRASNLLFVRIIQDAINRGARMLDLGGSGGLDGVEEFKRRLGAKVMYCNVIKIKSNIHKLFYDH